MKRSGGLLEDKCGSRMHVTSSICSVVRMFEEVAADTRSRGRDCLVVMYRHGSKSVLDSKPDFAEDQSCIGPVAR
ncbi:hypothetical protein AVEN_35864-1 [Araneus ventricosus]|uniref:Uncharacterized protein n=1 Tax=Araneus ventricosus TaxID=182803 RepID=A0A4Y2BJ75_ARAVE|nr:hypothetical protein AVEN_35864-1 [Araneus ventricosus]